MKVSGYIILFTLMISFCSCNENVIGPIPAGVYSYMSYDTTGTAIVKGWFTMSFQDSSLITGEWHFEKIGNPQDVGPQIGSGELKGSFEQDKILVELNPQYRDNNLQLSGTKLSDNYSGEWVWISFAGITNRGTFQAIRN